MSCKTYRLEIDEVRDVDAQLPAATEAHLRVCQSCRTFATERQTLRAIVGDLEKVAAPPDFDFRLRARLAADGARESRTGWMNFAPGAVSIALAACFALTVAAALRFKYPSLGNDIAATTQADKDSSPALLHERVEAGRAAPLQPPVESETSETSEPGALSGDISGVEQLNAARVSVTVNNGANTSRRRGAALFARGNAFVGYSGTADRQLDSATFDVSPASINRLGTAEFESRDAGDEMSFAVPVQAPGESMKIVLQDERGMSRVVAIDPVSFGAQKIAGRKSVAMRASLQPGEGVW